MRSLKGFMEFLHLMDEAVFPSALYCLCCGAMIDASRSYSLCDDCIRKFHWITGQTCDLCGKALPERLETDDYGTVSDSLPEMSEDEIAARPRLCYNCMNGRPLFTKGFSCLTYGLHERELMMDLKYADRGYIARKCGDMMFDRMEAEISSGRLSPLASPIDIIVPVPLDADRYRRRGYNQSALMARQFAARWRTFAREGAGPAGSTGDLQTGFRARSERFKAPVLYEDLLYRTRKTRKLRSLTPAERAMELEGVFRVRDRYIDLLHNGKGAGRSSADPTGCGVSGRSVEASEAREIGSCGKRVLLIDDILTTSATANACTKALLDAGAAEVFFLSWASGGNRRPDGRDTEFLYSKRTSSSTK